MQEVDQNVFVEINAMTIRKKKVACRRKDTTIRH